jgi:hypothetical protein
MGPSAIALALGPAAEAESVQPSSAVQASASDSVALKRVPSMANRLGRAQVAEERLPTTFENPSRDNSWVEVPQ